MDSRNNHYTEEDLPEVLVGEAPVYEGSPVDPGQVNLLEFLIRIG